MSPLNPNPLKILLIFLPTLILLAVPGPASTHSAKDYYLSGNNYLEEGMFSLAIDVYKKAVELNPYYKEAYYGLGKAYRAQDMHQEAEAFLGKAIELDTHYWQAHNELALVYEDQGLLDKAKEKYEKTILHFSEIPELHFNLARILTKQGKDAQAIAEYQKVLRIDPEYVLAHVNLGSLYLQLDDLDQAVTCYQQAAKLDPEGTLAHINLGDLYHKRGWDKQAADEYKKVLNISPDDPLVLSRLSNLHLAKREWNEAIKINKKRVASFPNSTTAHHSLGWAYQEKGNPSRARREYEEALKIDPDNEVARYYLENLLLRIEPSASLERRNYADYRLAKGDQYCLENKLPLAVYAYQRAIALSPQNPSPRLQLAELYGRQQHINQAITELTKARELTPAYKNAQFKLEEAYRALEKSISRKEGIDPASVPAPKVKMLLVKLSDKGTVRPGISAQMDNLISCIFNQSLKVSLIPIHHQRDAEKKLGIKEIDKIEDLFRVSKATGAQFALWGEITEEEERLDLKARLIDLSALNEVRKVDLSSRAKDRVEALSFGLASSILKKIPLEGVIIKVKPKEVIINLGARHGLEIGARLNVLKKGKVQRDPWTGKMPGKEREVIGQIEVISIEDNLSRARMLTYGLSEKIKESDIVCSIKEKS